MKPKFITFTGVDDRTDLQRLRELQFEYPIEWGVLFSGKNMDARYPSIQTVQELLTVSSQVSAHLCGDYAKPLCLPHNVCQLLPNFRRIQLNGYDIDLMHAEQVRTTYEVDVILQIRKQEEFTNHFHCLYDVSGGKGVFPSEIPILKSTGNPVGYAGGISPLTVEAYLTHISSIDNYWIDMESGVRTNGWFDLDKVEEVCRIVYNQNHFCKEY